MYSTAARSVRSPTFLLRQRMARWSFSAGLEHSTVLCRSSSRPSTASLAACARRGGGGGGEAGCGVGSGRGRGEGGARAEGGGAEGRRAPHLLVPRRALGAALAHADAVGEAVPQRHRREDRSAERRALVQLAARRAVRHEVVVAVDVAQRVGGVEEGHHGLGVRLLQLRRARQPVHPPRQVALRRAPLAEEVHRAERRHREPVAGLGLVDHRHRHVEQVGRTFQLLQRRRLRRRRAPRLRRIDRIRVVEHE